MKNIICTSCREENPPDAKFCIACRSPLPTSGKRVCARGHRLDPTWKECPFCKAVEAPAASQIHDLQPRVERNKTRHTMVEVQSHAAAAQPTPYAAAQHSAVPLESPASRHTQVSVQQPAPQRGPIVGALVAKREDGEQGIFPLFLGRNTIGSDPRASIVLTQDHSVSGKHAVLLVTENKIWVDDCLSTNGTEINGRVIEEKTAVDTMDTLQVGTTQFQIRRFTPFQ